MIVLPPDQRRTQPWKNGGGITHELWKEGRGASGFALRISIAEVSSDGPFSLFPGVDRVITLLEGPGFTLIRSDGLEIPLTKPYKPFSFLGEDAYQCTLKGGKVLDFNVMVDRASHSCAVYRAHPGEVSASFLLALSDGRIAGLSIQSGSLIKPEGPVYCEIPVMAVRIQS